MVTINDLPEHPGRLFFTRRHNLREQITVGGGRVDWKNVVVVDADGGGDFTDIQDAIDSITTATAGNEFLVLITGGDTTADYAIAGAITLKEFVHLKGIGPRVPLIQITTSGSTPGLDSVGTTHIEDLQFTIPGTNGVPININTGDDTHFTRCIISTSTTGVSVVEAGTFRDCTLTNFSVEIKGSGTNHEDSPHFYNCDFNNAYTITTNGTVDTGQFIACHFTTTRTDVDTVKFFLNIDSPDVLFSGCTFTTEDGAQIQTSGAYAGCIFFMDKGAISTIQMTGAAKFGGCTFHFTGTSSGSNNALFEVVNNVASGPNIMSGCTVHADEGRVFMFGSGYTNDSWPFVLSGITVDAKNLQLFLVHSSGCSGTPQVEMNGNYIHAGFSPIQLANAHATGQDIRLRGSNVQTKWFNVDPDAGTARSLFNFVPVGFLETANDVAYVNVGYVDTPIDIDDVLSTNLVVASNLAIENDTFTDTAGTNLNAHASDSGGSWTARAGTITISVGNQATVNAAELYTYSVTSVAGFIRASFTNSTGSGTRSAFLVFRWVDSSNYWFVEWSRETTSIKLFKRVAGVNTEMGEADQDFSTSQTLGVSFINDDIIVYTNDGLSPTNLIPVIRVNDSDGNTGTNVGIGGRGNAVVLIDDFIFHPSLACDITVDAEMTHEGEPFNNQSLTQSFSSGGGDAIPSVSGTPTYIDISTALNNLEQASFVSVKVTLDTTVSTDDLYIMGVMIYYLNFARDFQGDTALRQYRPFR